MVITRWRTATLGLDYKGVYRNYTTNTYYNGTDQSLGLIFQKQLSRHWNLTLREAAALLSRSLFYAGPYNFVDPGFAQTPTQDVFDGRTIYLATMGDLTYQYSARLSFNIASDGFLTRRRSSALYGDTGYRARADVAYRTSKNATSGASYDYTHFEYTKGFGGSDIHTFSLVQSYRFGRNWELGMQGGMSHLETLGITQVAIDPVIAAIIGRSTGIEVFHSITWVPSIKGHLTRTIRKGSINFCLRPQALPPEMGSSLTSRSQSATASFSYTAVRRLNFAALFGHTSYGSVSLGTLSNYSSYNGGTGFTYKISNYVSVVARYDYRHYDVEQTGIQARFLPRQPRFRFQPSGHTVGNTVVTGPVAGAPIMVIDDDPALLGFTSKYLARLGYSVAPYRNPEEAWKQFTIPASDYTLVVVDLSMPALSGEQLSRMMLEAKPGIRLIITSGYPFDIDKLRAAGGGERLAFLHKPFTPAMLAGTVARLLQDAADGGES